MDMENDQVGAVTKAGQERGIVQRLAHVMDESRKAGVRVIYVVARFRPGHPEAHPRNTFQMHNKKIGRLVEGEEGAEIHAAVAARPGEVIITKRRVNAFYNTDLDTVLRAQGIETLVMTGIATSGVILSTTRHAADADYQLVIIEDCSTDGDADTHNFLMQKVLARQANVVTADAYLAAIR